MSTTMDFFEHQEVARRKTGALVGYYALAVALIIVGVYAAFAIAFIGFQSKTGGSAAAGSLWNPALFGGVAGGTLLIVLLGTLYKVSQLSKGGATVARMLGGRPILSNTTDPDERKVLNVVEEMAIASGTPVPPVFLLAEERGINAFAAGFAPGDAVIGVTRGCVQQLSRDELQGVIAHEFSHVLNGDMRLNLRLVGVLHGILIIALTGYFIMRSGGRSRGSSRGKGSGAPILVLGLMLMAIGYIGVFFGKLIKSAVSRQREYLADASAVQFTRNPDGLAGALKKIAGFTGGSHLGSTHAEEASHFFFANGLKKSFIDLLSTHPPLVERIQRIDPMFDGNVPTVRAGARPAETAAGVSALAETPATPPPVPTTGIAMDPQAVVQSVGAPNAEHLFKSLQILADLPERVRAAAHEPSGARAVVYGLLLDARPEIRKAQLGRLAAEADGAVYAETRSLVADLEGVRAESRLPLVDIAIGTLKALSASQYELFRANVQALVSADQAVDLFEYALQRILFRHLDPAFGEKADTTVRYKTLAPLGGDVGALLSCLAYWGADDTARAQTAFGAGAARIEGTRLTMAPVEGCGLQVVDQALERLAAAAPAVKRQVLDGCATCVGSDGVVTIEEAELLRAISDSLDCPMPPILAKS